MVGSIISLSALAFVGQPTLAKQMDDWQLLRRPERVTELYFTDYRQTSASASSKTVRTVTFTVHNLEHQTTKYHYTIIAKAEQGSPEHQLGSGGFTLPHNQSVATTRTIKLPVVSGRVAIKIGLEYKSIAFGDNAPSSQMQSIQYWTATSGQVKEGHEGA